MQAHSSHLQRCFDKRNLPYGVQYEIARLITMGFRYDQILMVDLDKLQKEGSNATAAPKTAKVLLARQFEIPDGASHREF